MSERLEPTKRPSMEARRRAAEKKLEEGAAWLRETGLSVSPLGIRVPDLIVTLKNGDEKGVFGIDETGNLYSREKLSTRRIPRKDIEAVWRGTTELWRAKEGEEK